VRKWAVAAAILVAMVFIAGLVVNRRLPDHLKRRVEQLLADRFHAKVTIARLGVSFLPLPGITVEDVKLQNPKRADAPPFIEMKRFVARTDIITLFGAQRDVTLVRIEGLRITIPSGTMHVRQPDSNQQDLNQRDSKDESEQQIQEEAGNHFPLVIRKIIADGTVLVILPKQANRDPLEWDIEKLTLTSVGAEKPMGFAAILTNAKPPGLIHSTGTFGPWQKDDPGDTALGGKYLFQNADMSVFKGLSGRLSSTGTYKGTLSGIDVNGTTDIPDFKVGDGAQVDLKTRFSATVDGTNGNTLLHPVDATYRSSEFICEGGVIGTPGVHGKKIDLKVKTKKARIEDIFQLIMGDRKAALEGPVNFQARLLLPPGDVPVMRKLYLDGRFDMNHARFTSGKVQQKLDLYSNRSLELDDKANKPDNVASNLSTRFVLKNTTARLSDLTFSVPGIYVYLHGEYGLVSEKIDFLGRIRLHGTVSDMTTGFKSWLLKPIDFVFKKNGAGAVLPIKITGTRTDPHFGLDFRDPKNRIPNDSRKTKK
jgi:hypothetical protein